MMEGLREALEFITELKEGSMKPEVLQIGGKTYCTKRLERYGKPEYAKAIQANTLTSVSSYIVGKKEELRKSMVLHVESPSRVSLYSGLTISIHAPARGATCLSPSPPILHLRIPDKSPPQFLET